jgi:hypothetical protein
LREQRPIDPVGILEALVRHEVQFVLIGGVAANVHGYPLPTQDVDITPAPDRANYDRLAAALREINARIRVEREPDGVPFLVDGATLAGNVTWTLRTDRGNLDIVTEPAGTSGYRDIRRDAVDVELGDGLTIQVASLADIIRSKEAAGRPKDLAALPALRATLERLETGRP